VCGEWNWVLFSSWDAAGSPTKLVTSMTFCQFYLMVNSNGATVLSQI
jgi:hypothetical protein